MKRKGGLFYFLKDSLLLTKQKPKSELTPTQIVSDELTNIHRALKEINLSYSLGFTFRPASCIGRLDYCTSTRHHHNAASYFHPGCGCRASSSKLRMQHNVVFFGCEFVRSCHDILRRMRLNIFLSQNQKSSKKCHKALNRLFYAFSRN